MIRLLLVDNMPLRASLMRRALNQEPDLRVVATATNTATALHCVPACDVMLLDADLPDARALVHQALDTKPALSVLFVGTPNVGLPNVALLNAGTVSHVRYEDSMNHLLDAIRGLRSRSSTPKLPLTFSSMG